ncbi:hypothetical protein M427DRAFT_70873 [Gonapodya prolifera JEL478]|uniref:Uncharacterized protein n=1 Tax=Gonapodya prolifera (strain JEL478) TaxID=1344416 RepID=A0A139ABA9_GONPJ|nr:hypothetical protein M427DRAFT_70873 [Gonapodya prolifera JEL478]|eukprot:KXS13949.1 hypothetical protein M427DRAFT_70873 [Gonapodya prolifera JEL478]
MQRLPLGAARALAPSLRAGARTVVARRGYRTDTPGFLPSLKRPFDTQTTVGEIYDALFVNWPYKGLWWLVPFGWFMSYTFQATPISEAEKEALRARDAKLKSLEFHQE